MTDVLDVSKSRIERPKSTGDIAGGFARVILGVLGALVRNRQKVSWFFIALLLMMPAQSADAQNANRANFRGYLVDIACAAIHRTADDSWAVKHSQFCLRSAESQKSGYALVMPKGKILRFDASGNAKAIALIRKENREDHWLVEVTGEATTGPAGDVLLVESIRLLN